MQERERGGEGRDGERGCGLREKEGLKKKRGIGGGVHRRLSNG